LRGNRQPEVAQHHVILFAEQHILGFDIAVNDALFVRVLESGGNLTGILRDE
jgi:hypothetical protein